MCLPLSRAPARGVPTSYTRMSVKGFVMDDSQSIQRLDCINIFFMLISCAVAYFIPWQLLLSAYAILGPAHYLTQISWMHDRQYFTQRKFDYLSLIALIILLTVLPGLTIFNQVSHHHNNINEKIYFGLLVLMLGISSVLVLSKSLIPRVLMISSIIFIISFFISDIIQNKILFLILFLLPTLIHVYFFTAGFILNGAFKNKSIPGFLSFLVLLACGISFFVVSPRLSPGHSIFVMQNMKYFSDIATKIINGFDIQNSDQQILNIIRFAAFAYTYHYLNWFIKTKIIKWHEISMTRRVVMSTLYLFFIGLYLYNYSLGFAALLMLSFAHVVLEFPLDILMMKNIGYSCLKSLRILR